MEFNVDLFLKQMQWWQLTGIAVLTSFILTYISIPTIVKVSKHLNLYEKTSSRGSHDGSIPTLGGVAIFTGIVISGAIFMPGDILSNYRYVLAALVILFLVGIKDDLMVLDPKKKFIIQVFAALLITVFGDFRITTFQGFFGIEGIPYLVSVVITVFIYIVIINGFNLIDGIDGLASGVAILVTLSFGILFILDGQYAYAFGPLVLTGALVAFFRFNVFSSKNKIFLGDTGSLTIGFVVAVIMINFVERDHFVGTLHQTISVPAMAFAILVVPLFDTLRVFMLRIFGGESPFNADRKHIHHRLLDLGFSHIKATMIIIAANLLIIGVALLFQNLRGSLIVLIILIISSWLSYIPVFLVDTKRRNEEAPNN